MLCTYPMRPCRICRRWFRPDPRSRGLQQVCSDAVCQRERHRRSCAEWHRSNALLDRERRFEERLKRDLEEPAGRSTDPLQTAPLARVAWPVARDAI